MDGTTHIWIYNDGRTYLLKDVQPRTGPIAGWRATYLPLLTADSTPFAQYIQRWTLDGGFSKGSGRIIKLKGH